MKLTKLPNGLRSISVNWIEQITTNSVRICQTGNGCRSVFITLSKVFVGTKFRKNALEQMFGRVLNMPMEYVMSIYL